MKILGIDTSTKFLSLGVYDNGKIYEYDMDLGIKNSSLLTVTIQRVMDALGWGMDDIDYFACGLGPGSFTGLRVGVATIKGLSWSLNKPILGVSSLDILAAYGASKVSSDKVNIVPVVDAKRNLIYSSIYSYKNLIMRRNGPYMLIKIDDLIKKIKSESLFLGDALNLYKEQIGKGLKQAKFLDKDYWYPKGRYIVQLAALEAKENKFKSPRDIDPIYLYPKECQIKSYEQK